MWSWEKGSTDIGLTATYGTQGIEAANNNPASKFGSAAVTDLSGNFWLFGGFDAQTQISNELWKFNPATKRWTFVKGQGNIGGNYGTMGVPSITNTPGSRAYTAMWTDLSGKFWMFGGYGIDANTNTGELSDLWMINSLSLLPDRRIVLQGRNDGEKNMLNWRIVDISGIQKFIVEKSSDNINFQTFKAVDPQISSLVYQADDNSADAQQNYYRIKILYNNSHAYSNTIALNKKMASFVVYPNPATTDLYIKLNSNTGQLSYTLYNAAGALINRKNMNAGNIINLDISNLIPGEYHLKLIFQNEVQWASFIKQ